MGWFDDNSDQAQAYQTVQDEPHKAKLSHELLGGAASYYAMKKYEDHCAANGQPASHAQAKELLAGFAGAFIDREVETKGEDFYDRETRERAQRHAENQLGDASYQDYNQ